MPATLGDVADLDVAADGSTIVVGTVGSPQARDVTVARYRPDGELDPAISEDGVVTVDSGGADAGLTVLAEPRGSILVGGSADERFLLVRLARDGQLDPSLDHDGVLIRSELMPVASIALASGDRIVVGSGIRADAEVTAAAVRLRADGSPDPQFGTDGVGRIDPRFTPFADFGAHLAKAVERANAKWLKWKPLRAHAPANMPSVLGAAHVPWLLPPP